MSEKTPSVPQKEPQKEGKPVTAQFLGREEDDEMSSLMTSAMRPSAQNALQHLLASELAAATFATDPLQKIRHVIEAYELLEDEKRALVLPKEEDRAEIDILYKNCISFLKLTEMPAGPYDNYRFACIPWAFATTCAYDYMRQYVYMYPMDSYPPEYEKCLKDGDEEAWRSHLYNVARRTGQYAPMNECIQLRNCFVDYAIPKMITLLRKIHENFISPEVWESTITSMRGGKVKNEGSSDPF